MEEVSEYERLREKNILESQRLMRSLGMEEVSKALLSDIRPIGKKSSETSRPLKRKRNLYTEPVRRSSRLQSKATGEKPQSLAENDLAFFSEPSPAEKRPAGELKISETLLAYEHEDSETVASERDAADYAKFLGAFQNENWYIETVRQPAVVKIETPEKRHVNSYDKEGFEGSKNGKTVKLEKVGRISTTTVACDSCKGVPTATWTFEPVRNTSKFVTQIKEIQSRNRLRGCPSRIYSILFYPSSSMLMVVAGDKTGAVGFSKLTNYHEDVSESDVWHFKPHVGPINGLAISNEDGDHMYTCSFDGSTRMMDINKGYFEEVFVDEEDLCKSVELIAPKQLAIALHSGDVLLADCRIPPYMHHKLKLGHPRLRTVSIHPLHRDYFCTASANGIVAVWDFRGKKAHPVMEMKHDKAVNSAYFSSQTGNRILTASMDNRITVWNAEKLKTGEAKKIRSISHDNHVGRWLTNFRPTYHPSNDHYFIVGSMQYPRRVEIFDDDCTLTYALGGATTVCSLNCFHPSVQVIAGGNSSGYITIWTGSETNLETSSPT